MLRDRLILTAVTCLLVACRAEPSPAPGASPVTSTTAPASSTATLAPLPPTSESSTEPTLALPIPSLPATVTPAFDPGIDSVALPAPIPDGAIARLGTGSLWGTRLFPDLGQFSVTTLNEDVFFDLTTFDQVDTPDDLSSQPSRHLYEDGCDSLSHNGLLRAENVGDLIIEVQNAQTDEVLMSFTVDHLPHSGIGCFAFNPSDSILIGFAGFSGSLDAPAGDPTAYVWDLETGLEITRLVHDANVKTVQWSPNGGLIATGTGHYSDRGGVTIWSADTYEVLHHWGPLPGTVYNVQWSPNGAMVAAAVEDEDHNLSSGPMRGSTSVWNVRNGEEVFSEPVASDGITWLDSQVLLSTSRDNVILWDRVQGQPVNILQAMNRIDAFAWSPDGTQFAARFYWQIPSYALWQRAEDSTYQPAPLAEDVFAAWPLSIERSYAGSIREDMFTNPQQTVTAHIEHPDFLHYQVSLESRAAGQTIFDQAYSDIDIYSAAFSPDGSTFAIGFGAPSCFPCPSLTTLDENFILLIDTQSGAARQLVGHVGPVMNLLWYSDSTMLASISHDGTIIIWDLSP